MSKLAKALYDNTAECADELEFRRGDIITVVDQNVAGTSGWWMCSLYGRHGLAPANRLQLLPLNGTTRGAGDHVQHEHKRTDATTNDSVQNIYQIPSVPRVSSSPAYERMDVISPAASSASQTQPALGCSRDGPYGHKPLFFSSVSSPKVEIYDVPAKARQTSHITAPTTPSQMPQKHSLVPNVELEKRLNPPESFRCTSPTHSYVYAVPLPLHQDPNYDIPVPSENQQKRISGYSTLPNTQKSEWLYDVPVGPEKKAPPQGSCDTLPSKPMCRQFCGTSAWPIQQSRSLVYDIPKHTSVDSWTSPKELPRIPMYNKPPNKITEESIYVVPAQEEPLTQFISNPPSDHIPLECRVDPNNAHELKRVRLQRMRNFLAVTSFTDLPRTEELPVQENYQRGRAPCLKPGDSQRISTASSSSTSSCDSLALSSSSPEPLREVTLSQEESCRRLADLQESVSKAVPRLMNFVSSHWRRKEHLEQHLNEIKEAAEGIAGSLTCFLNFALDIKGNAYRLTDVNLQTRLYKQLSIVEDSSVILQQTVGYLTEAGWPLGTLCQDPAQGHPLDQLDRFVMVARTVPEDIKRLVSIINANGKLLFRPPQKDPEPVHTTGQPENKKGHYISKQVGDNLAVEDDNDYVELQNESDKQEKEVQRDHEGMAKPAWTRAQDDDKHHSHESGNGTKSQSSYMSEHCRLYFGALQKAIGGFVSSLQNGQTPEKFIPQSKLVIMVGQRLVDTLCREAQRQGSNHGLLHKSTHLCALLKQLAVATKKAALHFPDKQALQEVQEFAKELAQRAQHFRVSLDL